MQYGQMYLPKIFQKVITYYLFISIIFFTTKCKNTMLINVIHVYRENESVNQESRSTGNSGDNATLSNISAISWRPVLVVEEAGENHRPWASN
jgi:hypothetical protein